MTNSPKRDFHRAVYHNISNFAAVFRDLSAMPEIKAAYEKAPPEITQGRTLTQLALDDLLESFVIIMREIPDKSIPSAFYKQMLSEREGRSVSEQEAFIRMDDALLKKRSQSSVGDDMEAPEFMLLLGEVLTPEAALPMVNLWLSTVQQFGGLLWTDDAHRARNKAVAIAQSSVNSFNGIVNGSAPGKNPGKPPVISPGKKNGTPPSNDNGKPKDPDLEGAIIHNPEQIESVEKEMDRLIGLNEPKTQIAIIKARVEYKQARIAAGFVKDKKDGMDHYVFRGNPGTGKTTFARLIGKIYADSGLLKRGHVVEVSRSGLVEGYVGQTAKKTEKVIEAALDGVLFVDEAYSLFGEGKDFGREALETILRYMEVHKDRLIVVFAGYPKEMNNLIQSNPGLTRRFKHTINFQDFQMDELMEIFDKVLARSKLSITPEAHDAARQIIERSKNAKGSNFGNAGEVENLVEKLEDAHALNMKKEGTLEKVKQTFAAKAALPDDLKIRLGTIGMDEIVHVTRSQVVVQMPQTRHKIGFI